MKLLYIFILGLFLFSCSDSSFKCINQGQLCDKYLKDYFKCKWYEFYNNDYYPGTYSTYIDIRYKVKNTEGEWTYWDTYNEMYNYYCCSEQNSNRKQDGKTH